MILDDIVAHKRTEVALLHARQSLDGLRTLAASAAAPRDFMSALRGSHGAIRMIAEIKRKSPSKGIFNADLDAAHTAQIYAAGGAACISVLTDERFFMGHLPDLSAVRQAVALPVLRKDFLIDEAQIYESRAAGADAILLIAAILDDERLSRFSLLTARLGMGALIEIHDEVELERILPLEPALVGINNRDLRTFRTDTVVSERLRARLPDRCLVVGESGIHSRADVERLQRAGLQAILVGESLVTAAHPQVMMRELLGETDPAMMDSGRKQGNR